MLFGVLICHLTNLPNLHLLSAIDKFKRPYQFLEFRKD